ncbi:peptidase S58 DmpA, partial [Streptomyces sp. ZEA17I]
RRLRPDPAAPGPHSPTPRHRTPSAGARGGPGRGARALDSQLWQGSSPATARNAPGTDGELISYALRFYEPRSRCQTQGLR